ncbi:RNA-directed DNA polymerase, eukaryota, reverse transcriptase zinc-binding domain protein, partial [Tanacetum coccineum]
MNTGNKQKEVKKFINDGNLQVCSIIETHIKDKKVKETCDKVFDRWEWVTNSSLSANSCRIMGRMINLFSSFVYASNNGNERRTLWKDLTFKWGSTMTKEMQEFSDCFNLVEVEDIGSSGFFYTWSKSLTNPHNTVLKKLDRVMVSEEFLMEFNGSHAIFQPFLVSDHSPCLLVIHQYKKPKSFRFANYIANKPEFLQTVSEGWKTQVAGYKMFCLVKKLKHMKSLMNKLNWKHGDLTIRVKNLKVKLKDAQSLVEKDPYVKVRAVEALFEYNEAVKDEESLLAQKARVAWLDARDKNSAFFHKVIKGRRSRNRVDTICDENGNSYDRDDVPMQFVKHFQQFLGFSSVSELEISDDLFITVLTNEEAVYMVREVSNKEIKEAMFDIGDNKAPGLMDFPQWELNATLITLVPKIHDPPKVSDFGPIACCNVLYKCISKIITNRIKGALKKLVQINQSAFIPDRLIQDNILLSQEILRGYGRKNGPKRCAMKIDLQKAYDTISWSFGDHIVQIWFSQQDGGLDYAMCQNCRKIRKNDKFKYHHGCKELQLVILCFADDLMIFCHGDVNSAGYQLKKVMQFKEGALPSKYLGVPLITKRLGVKDCQMLIDKIKGRTADWKCKYLSYAGGILLIAAILESMSAYWASFFKLPKTVVKEIKEILQKERL